MIARIARTLLLLQFAAITALAAAIDAWWLPGHAWGALGLGLLTVILLRCVLTANTFFLSRSRKPAATAIDADADATLTPAAVANGDAHRLGLRASGKLFLQELAASLLCTSLAMPFRRFDKRIGGSRGYPVLLVHGYGCNSGYWFRMSQVLQRAGITHYAVDLEPVLGSIDSYVAPIRAAIDRMRAETGNKRVILLAHSMGGLAARAYMRDCGDAALAGIITLGTPHRGTRLAMFGLGVNSAEMRWLDTMEAEIGMLAGAEPNPQEAVDSSWLQRLAAAETAPEHVARRRRILSIYSLQDNIVAPQRSGHLPHARNIAVQAVGHVALALDPQIQRLVMQEITRISADAA